MADPEPDWEYRRDREDGVDYCRKLIDWLSDKSPDAWHMAARRLNWDQATPVISWIVNRPEADRATVQLLFWGASPDHHLERFLRGECLDGAGGAVFDSICRNSDNDFYSHSELASDSDLNLQSLAGRIKPTLQKLDGVSPTFTVAPWLLKPIAGRAPNVPAEHAVAHNRELRDCLNALGTMALSAEEEAWLDRNKRKPIRPSIVKQRWSKSPGVVSDPDGWTVAKWIAAYAVLVMTTAVVVRRINFGVWF